RRRHTRSLRDWSSDVCSSDLFFWGESGCSMCAGGNGDCGEPGERCVSTTNRNFENRQGPKVRTHLASPETAAATAIAGHIADVRSEERRVGKEWRCLWARAH